MIPIEVLTMAGGAAMGGLFKFMDQAQKNKQAQMEMMMKDRQQQHEHKLADRESASKSADAAANRVGNDPFAKMTRRIFVLSMVAMGAWAMIAGLTGLDIVVPVQTQTGGSYLFGLVDTTKNVTEYLRFENAVVEFEWLKISLLAAGSFYLGKS
jgi:hypothetical protein